MLLSALSTEFYQWTANTKALRQDSRDGFADFRVTVIPSSAHVYQLFVFHLQNEQRIMGIFNTNRVLPKISLLFFPLSALHMR